MSQLTVFITGATAGFGAATARRFAKDKHKLILTGRRLERLEALKKELDTDVHIVALDVRDEKAVRAAVAALPDNFKNVDVLVNNAGLALGLEPAHLVAMSDWETMIDTNIKGLLYCTQALLTGMVERGKGHVINLGSVAGSYPYPGGNVYGATKAFVKQFSLNLRADLVAQNIRVTDVEPGLAESEFSVVRFKGDAEKAKDVYKGTEPITPDNVAEVIYFTATFPANVNINRIELMAACQAFSPFNVVRK